MCNLGFFYVKINPSCSSLEFLSLLEKIPFEQFYTPGTHQISASILTTLFGDDSEKLVMQLMVLGDFFKYWFLVNPYKKMIHSPDNIKLLLSSMGNLYVVFTPGYFQNCLDLVKSVELTTMKQLESHPSIFY